MATLLNNYDFHEGPNLYMTVTANDTALSLTITNPSKGKFGYPMTLYARDSGGGDTLIEEFRFQDYPPASNIEYDGSWTGSSGEPRPYWTKATSSLTLNASKTYTHIRVKCGAGSSCESGGDYLVDITDYTPHTHSAPSGGKASVSAKTQTSLTVKRELTSWGCSDASSWTIYYKKSSDSSYSSLATTLTSTTKEITGLTAGTNYNIYIIFKNAHGYTQTTTTITERTHYATPVVSVSNNNKYSNKAGVSASTNSITVSASNSANNTGTLTWKYRIKKSDATSYGSYQTSATFTGLSSGTTYIVEAYAENADGYSATNTVTIRTKYAQSNFTTSITSSDIGLEHIDFNATVKYGTINAISSGKWSVGTVLTNQSLIVSSNAGSGKTGYVLAANTKYKISVSATLTSTYDDITCTFDKEFTTDAKCSFADTLGNFDFCYASEVAANYKITNPSGNKVRCSLIVANTTILTRDKSSSWDSSVDLQLTDAEWDAIYKKLGNSNSIAYAFRVGTYSNKDSNYTTYTTDSSGTITLAGKKLTGHIGVSNKPRRAQAFMGVSNAPRKAVVWIGDENNKPRRCI